MTTATTMYGLLQPNRLGWEVDQDYLKRNPHTKQLNTIGVDLAKHVVQISIVAHSHKALCNKALTLTRLIQFPAKQPPWWPLRPVPVPITGPELHNAIGIR